MMEDTTAPSYWLNWRFFLCALWILIAMVGAGILILKYDGFRKGNAQRRDDHQEKVGVMYMDETWRTCLKKIHPAWLLSYRLIAFSVLLALLIADVVRKGGGIFYFYTQWTFALVTFYFGLGSALSIYGCCKFCYEMGEDGIKHVGLDAERGTYMAPSLEENLNLNNTPINSNNHGEHFVRKTAGFWGYVFQIVFQISAGAVGLTDSVYWCIIYPFLTPASYRLNFLMVSMHSFNAVFLIGEVILNCLRFPFFRLAYFALWTCTFVIFQWIIHACVSMWWPYPFLDLSSPYAPVWYLAVGLIHLPCYGVFALIVRVKRFCLSRFSKRLGW